MNFELSTMESGFKSLSAADLEGNHDALSTRNEGPSSESRAGVWSGVETMVVADPQVAFAELLALKACDLGLCRSAPTATSVDEAVQLIAGRPDTLVLADMRLPGGGIESLIEHCRHLGSAPRYAILSNPLSALQRERCLHLPLVGVINKQLPLNQLLADLRDIVQRKDHWTSYTSRPLNPTAPLDGPVAIIGQLNPRQYQVLLLLAEGLSVKLVAQRLKVSVKTVDSLKYRLMKQLEFHDRVELTRFAIREGLIDP